MLVLVCLEPPPLQSMPSIGEAGSKQVQVQLNRLWLTGLTICWCCVSGESSRRECVASLLVS